MKNIEVSTLVNRSTFFAAFTLLTAYPGERQPE